MAFRPVGRSVTFHFQNLVIYRKELADRIVAQAGPQSGHVRILLSDLDEATRNELLGELSFLAKMKAPDDIRDNQKMNEIIISEATREAKAKAAEQSGIDQLKLYYNAGLADSERNKNLLVEYIEKNCNSIFNAATVRVAVESCRVNLEWRKIAPPPPPVTQQPAETLVTLSDGSVQLPLDKPVPRSATVEQAKDYLARVRAQQPYARSGSFGTRF